MARAWRRITAASRIETSAVRRLRSGDARTDDDDRRRGARPWQRTGRRLRRAGRPRCARTIARTIRLYQFQWNLQQLELERAWDINTGAGSAVVVAVIDSGVAYTAEGSSYAQAPDLAGTTFVPGYDFIWDDDSPLDLDGHGTHVTGTIAQSTNNNLGVAGIAFNVSIMPDQGDQRRVGRHARLAQRRRRRRRRASHPVCGGPRREGHQPEPRRSARPAPPLRDAVQFAVDKGAVVVIAAGNAARRAALPLSGRVRQGHRGRDRRRAPRTYAKRGRPTPT